MPKVISRADARQTGLKVYFTGKPCPQGHRSVKYVGNKQCKECGSTRARLSYERNFERHQSTRRLRNRGVDQETYDKMVQECGNRCSICRSELASGRGSWHVDHCHSSGKIRGLLCHHCNTALGLARDSVPVLKSMIEYLEKWDAAPFPVSLPRNTKLSAWASVPPPKDEIKS